MPSAPPRYCTTPGCPNHQPCPDHAKTSVRRNPTLAKVYASQRWKLLRRSVLYDHPVCQHTGCRTLSTDVDHIVSLEDGGAPYDRNNLQALCKSHHGAKTAHEVRTRIY